MCFEDDVKQFVAQEIKKIDEEFEKIKNSNKTPEEKQSELQELIYSAERIIHLVASLLNEKTEELQKFNF